MLKTLADNVALITGAGSGIGRGLAEALAAQGMRLVVADINEATLGETSAALTEANVAHIAAPLDIRDAAAWQDLLQRAERELGPVQFLGNMAGVTVMPTPALELSDEAFSWVVDINLKGTWNGASAVARRLKALGLPGHIVNTSSVQGLISTYGFTAYSASKHAIMGLSETLRIELAEHDIGVSVLCPGPTRGNILNNSRAIAPDLVKEGKLFAKTGFSHFQTPREVADKVVAAVLHNQLYILTHPEYRPLLEARWRVLDTALGQEMNPDAAANVCEVEEGGLVCYREAVRDYS